MMKEITGILKSFKLDTFYKSIIYLSAILLVLSLTTKINLISASNLLFISIVSFIIGNLMWLIDESIRRLNISTIGKHRGLVPPSKLFHFQIIYTTIWIVLNIILFAFWIYLLWKFIFN